MKFLLYIYFCPFKLKSSVLGGYLYKSLTVEQQTDANFAYHVFKLQSNLCLTKHIWWFSRAGRKPTNHS